MTGSNKKKYPALEMIIQIFYVLGILAIITGVIGIFVALSMRNEFKIIYIIVSIILGIFGSVSFFGRAEMLKLFIDIANNIASISGNTLSTQNESVPTELDSTFSDSYEWMEENLDVDKFRNGDPIPEAKTNKEWKIAGKNGQPAWCYYDNDPANGKKYGKLYNWYAVADTRGLAPKGWNIPNDEKWKQFTVFLGGKNIAGRKMKSISGWYENGNGTNESGFNGQPGGSRGYDGFFSKISKEVNFWCTQEYNNINAYCQTLNYDNDNLQKSSFFKGDGFYVRCIKD